MNFMISGPLGPGRTLGIRIINIFFHTTNQQVCIKKHIFIEKTYIQHTYLKQFIFFINKSLNIHKHNHKMFVPLMIFLALSNSKTSLKKNTEQ